MLLGELWRLDELAVDGRCDVMLTAKRLDPIGGVGSPAVAMAVR
jgi:hypothetical protein